MKYENLQGVKLASNITLYNCDCMELLRQTPDKYYSLSIVDPPYGIGEDGLKNHSRKGLARATKYTPKEWDRESAPKYYFDELMRISYNQIIWGANHFISKIAKDSSCWIVWDKVNYKNDFADCELAYTSFKGAVRMFSYQWSGFLQGNMKSKETRIHPTQKPVDLYKWLLKNYAKPEFKIIDTHLGSGSSAIAAYDYGCAEFVGCEIDKEYYDASIKRFKKHIEQQTIF